ncbi:hypothetical protein VTJ49DRAFT_2698 [Mycothermus thermophilus]|uniref:U6 snRNA-associated Sm-like protein LSm6 n=1 Tax=Humicola insolens TaxID=85995 RepID=A0ABR3V9J4_HUMIN
MESGPDARVGQWASVLVFLTSLRQTGWSDQQTLLQLARSDAQQPHLFIPDPQDMENGAATQGEGAKDPSGFLSEIIGNPVTVKLNSGVVYKGELQSVDGYMNIALEKTEEYVNGVKRRSYGDAFVRGNNGQ